jgi:hypothetical protein
MTDDRWVALMNDGDSRLTTEEMDRGWHWCWDWDQLLVGPGMMEMDCCNCGSENIPPAGIADTLSANYAGPTTEGVTDVSADAQAGGINPNRR